jgi:outer membrane immunogenic protein
VNPQVSVYAKGGYTNARLNLEDGNTSYGFNNGGFRLGGGVEVAVSQPIVARLEYRYSDYGRTHIEGQDTGISIRRHQVVAALVTRF